MTGNKLARVRWYLGQTLLPDHFRAEDEALTSELRTMAQLTGMPSTGIHQLSWNAELLAAGTLSINSLLCVFSGGQLVDLPGNAICPPLSLEDTGRVRLTVYLHLTHGVQAAEGNRLYENDPSVLQREIRKLRLATESAVDNQADTIRLADVEKDVSGIWRVAESYIPPLLSVGGHPFLVPYRARLKRVLDWFDVRLRAQHVDSYASRERLGIVRRCFVTVAALRARLVDLDQGVDLHPFPFYDRIRELHREVCLLDEVLPDEPPPYAHENPVTCFEPLLKAIERRVSPTPDITHHVQFVRSGDLFRLSPIPPEVEKAAECYLLVQKQNLGETPSLAGVKMASPSRLQIVQQLVLTGVPLKHVPVPPFRHPFGPNIDFYRLVTGEEWEHALREHAAVLFAPPALVDTRFALFWRNA